MGVTQIATAPPGRSVKGSLQVVPQRSTQTSSSASAKKKPPADSKKTPSMSKTPSSKQPR
ncbi:hypothetical protein PsYK624_062920 [Phanerochaete sordida]|uniref:Uncharacterized protein n=1 Tax=Phanerochaete sordida TaxID=48140 RepID=A0A9P3G8H4_9APHY|nr:hypothetical protein PsYK624_062920 [Phanerochaete sordida]